VTTPRSTGGTTGTTGSTMTGGTGTSGSTMGGSTATTSYPQVSQSRGRSASTAETKPAFKTTELVFYVLAVIGVLIATQVVDGFRANQGWLYVTILTVGYMVSRGIAKSGSYAKDHDPRVDAYPDGR
jgi:hypothetical protein